MFSRYADFIVNEVDTDGNVVQLTCLEPPPQVGLLLSVGFLCKVCNSEFFGYVFKRFLVLKSVPFFGLDGGGD